MITKDNFTEKELDYIALWIIRAVYQYASQGSTVEEKTYNQTHALEELRRDSLFSIKYDLNQDFFKHIEKIGIENGYWE